VSYDVSKDPLRGRLGFWPWLARCIRGAVLVLEFLAWLGSCIVAIRLALRYAGAAR
jgi:uncharacterized membrane protein